MINHLGTIAKSGTKAFMEVSYRADLFIACLNFRVCPFSVLLLVHSVIEAVSSGADMSMIGWPSDRAMTFAFFEMYLVFLLSFPRQFIGSLWLRTPIHQISLELLLLKGQFGVGFYSPWLGWSCETVKSPSHQVDLTNWRIEVRTSCQKKFVWFQRATMMNSTSGNPLREALKFNIWCTQAF